MPGTDKTLAFRISIQRTSEEAKKIAALEVQLAKLNKRRAELIKKSKEAKGLTNAETQALARNISRTRDLSQAKQQLGKVETQNSRIFQSSKGSMAQLRAETARLRQQIDQINTSNTKGRQKYEQIRKQIVKNTTAIRNHDRAISGSKTLVGEYQKGFVGAFKKIGGAITGVIAVFYALNRVVGGAIRNFSEFEKTLTNVQTLLEETNVTLSDDSRRIMREYGLAIQDTNKALFDAISAGVDAADSYEFMNVAAKLAIGGVTGLATSVDGLTSIINAYGLETAEAEQVASAFFSAQKFGKTTVQELADSIGQVAPVARLAGISYQELLSTYAELTKQGIKTEEANTAIKATILATIKPSEQAKKKFKELGIEVGLNAVRSQGLFTILTKISAAAEKDADSLTQLIPNVRALTGVGALGTEQLEDFHKILETVNIDFGEGSSLINAYNIQMETAAKRWDVAKARARDFGIEIGSRVVPALLDVVEGFMAIETESPFHLATKQVEEFAESLYDLPIEEQQQKIAGFITEIQDQLGRATTEGLRDERRKTIGAWFGAITKGTQHYKDQQLELNILKDTTIPSYIEILDKLFQMKERVIEQGPITKPKEKKKVTPGGDSGVAPTLEVDPEGYLLFTKMQLDAEEALFLAALQASEDEFVDAELRKAVIEERHRQLKREQEEVEQEWRKEKRKEEEKDILDKAARELEIKNRVADGAMQIVGLASRYFNQQREIELAGAGDNAKKREEIERKFAKKQQKIEFAMAVITGARAIVNALATLPFTPMGPIAAGIAAAATGIQLVTIAKQKFAKGGKIRTGSELPGSQKGTDNTLILGTPGEAVVNERQQRRLGGPAAFRKAGVPGFASGGVIAPEAAPIQSAGYEMDLIGFSQRIVDGINQKQVVLNMNELSEATEEHDLIMQPDEI